MSTAFWICSTITSISAVVSLGYSVAALRSSKGTTQTNALYACSRSLALAVVALIVLFTRSADWLKAVATAMIIVQAGDALIGARIRDQLKTAGPALTAAANLAALIYLVHKLSRAAR